MTNEKMLASLYDLRNIYGGYEIDKYIEIVKEDLRAETQKKKGNSKRDALIKKMVKSTDREIFKHYHEVDKQYGFTDGFRAYILNDNYGYDNVAEHNLQPFKLKGFKSNDCNIELKIDIADLEFFIKDLKAQKKKGLVPYIIENDKIKIAFNPNYLLEFLKMFNTDTIYCKAPNVATYYENEQGEWGVLLPVRIRKETI